MLHLVKDTSMSVSIVSGNVGGKQKYMYVDWSINLLSTTLITQSNLKLTDYKVNAERFTLQSLRAAGADRSQKYLTLTHDKKTYYVSNSFQVKRLLPTTPISDPADRLKVTKANVPNVKVTSSNALVLDPAFTGVMFTIDTFIPLYFKVIVVAVIILFVVVCLIAYMRKSHPGSLPKFLQAGATPDQDVLVRASNAAGTASEAANKAAQAAEQMRYAANMINKFV
jgi:hypothetical protein